MELSEMTLDELTDKIADGKIPDAKTVSMTFLVKEFKERGKI